MVDAAAWQAIPAVENAVQTQLHPRFRKRVPCAFVEQGVAHRGMVLNLSKRGLFVGTRVTPRVGSRVWLELSPTSGPGARGIPVRVVWKRVVHRAAASALQDRGIGLEVEGEWAAYERFFDGQVPAIETPPTHAVRLLLRGTPRTRVIDVRAESAAQAAERALDSLSDEEWQVLSIAALPAPRGSTR